tara:strand:+ start:104 stop:637 length:534 start_codon:yes stop_codon:yes gene_type:complete
MVRVIHDFIHEYSFNYTSLLEPIKQDLIDGFYKTINHRGYDMNVESHQEIFAKVNGGLDRLIEENYFVGNKLGEGNGSRIYIQNKDKFVSKLHDHTSIMSSIHATFYLNIPKTGGEISFNYLDNEIKIKPEINKIYVFPYWLPHKPLPQEDEVERICFNWSYASIQRPVHKLYLIKW